MAPYLGDGNAFCSFCDFPASHVCDVGDKAILVCRLHFTRTKVEHQATNHRELSQYSKWLKENYSNKKLQPEVEMSGLF